MKSDCIEMSETRISESEEWIVICSITVERTPDAWFIDSSMLVWTNLITVGAAGKGAPLALSELTFSVELSF